MLHTDVLPKRWQGSAPGKLLLFGEYGVLHGFPAVAATLPAERVTLSLELSPLPQTQMREVIFESALIPGGAVRLETTVGGLMQRFLPEGLPEAPAQLGTVGRAVAPELSRDARFIALALTPFDSLLPAGRLHIRVLEAFSPALGLGSSSALLGLLHEGLWHLLAAEGHSHSPQYFWMYVRAALRLLQGGGSGYDVAVQRAASERRTPTLWSYLWDPKGATFVPNLQALEGVPLADFGLLLETGVYSDTAHHVSAFLSVSDAQALAARHGALAQRFLAAPRPERLPTLMAESRQLAAAQGLLGGGTGPLGALEATLDQAGIPFKTTGAGHGDCLWVLAARNQLEPLPDPLEPGQSLAHRVRQVFQATVA